MALDRAKLEQAILYFANHEAVSELGMTKLYKLLYFADSRHLREHGHSITGSEYIKYDFGPVPSRGEKAVKALRREDRVSTTVQERDHYSIHLVEPLEPSDTSKFSPDELETLEATATAYGRATAAHLSDLSHAEPAWLSAGMLQKLSPALMHYGAAEDPDGL